MRRAALLLVLAVLCGSACAQPVVNVYSSMAEKDLRRLAAEFESRHGIKVNLWRSGKNRMLQRVLSEARAGRHEVDVIHNPAPEMEALHREKLLQPMRSPRLAELIPQAVAAHREWAGPRVYLFVQAYNTRLVTKPICPKRTSICCIRAGRAASPSRARSRNGSTRSCRRWAKRRGSSSSAHSRPMACRCEWATHCSPTSLSPVTCLSLSLCTAICR